MNQCPPGPQVFHWSIFEFFREFTEIFANKCLSFITGVNDTGDELFSGVNDTGEKFIAGVVDTADKHSFANISPNFRKNLKWS
jgi:hypothetical protein